MVTSTTQTASSVLSKNVQWQPPHWSCLPEIYSGSPASSGQPAGSLFTHKSATIMQQLSCIATSRILLRNSLVFFADDAACRSCSTSHHPQSPPSFSSLPSIQGTHCVPRRLMLGQLTGEGASSLKSRQKNRFLYRSFCFFLSYMLFSCKFVGMADFMPRQALSCFLWPPEPT